MPKFGKRSTERLLTCDPQLQEIMQEVVKIMDIKVLCGERSEEAQNKAYEEGNSKLQYPQSKHNSSPSKAVDVVPYPIDWEDLSRFERMCGIIEGVAHCKGIEIRLGRDFSFNDYPHIELQIID